MKQLLKRISNSSVLENRFEGHGMGENAITTNRLHNILLLQQVWGFISVSLWFGRYSTFTWYNQFPLSGSLLGLPGISGFQPLLGSAFALGCEPVLSLLCLSNFSTACFCVVCPASQLCLFLLFFILPYINDGDLLSVHKSWHSFLSIVSSSIFWCYSGA